MSDLSGGTVISGPDYTGLHTSPQNANWGQHGTWMASIIAGHGHDGGYDGVMGIAPEAKVLSIRVIPDKGDPGYRAYNNEPEQTHPGRARRRDHDRGQGPRPGDQHVDRLLGAERRGAQRDHVRLPARHRPGRVLRQLGRQRHAARQRQLRAWRRCRSPPSTRAWSAWARSPSTARRPASRAATSPSRSPRQARASPPRGGTAATTPSTARARRARSWRASPR